MNHIRRAWTAALLAMSLSSATAMAQAGSQPNSQTPADQARADSGRMRYTPADVRFLQGMIGHHAQAIVMSRWAPTHGAGESVKILASRIDVSQRDEIALMQRWLSARREATPEVDHVLAGHSMSMPAMPGMSHDSLMPGMLTPEQMRQLDAAKGAEFDRLFLTFMIQHHQGALTMVNDLFSHPGAGQDIYVFRFASDVEADQTTEIDRMRSMLAPYTEDRP
jgi:uncharacterized protein (DUF305 family)